MIFLIIFYVAIGFKVSSWVALADPKYTPLSILLAIIFWPLVLVKTFRNRKRKKV